ncbi:unnamed protein product [Brassica rapa]|uniref:Uncharacterized protein n=1 Tax=Brassica campestris TaxID=3711 RepID=A0A3P6CWX6_BRACM|nr:unnamed protein product [Brassica rapa]VDD23133.1 unnamed protein product [Brassica rapa]
MGSRGESDEQFTFDPEYSPPNIVDLETHQLLASLTAAEKVADQIDEGSESGIARKKQGMKESLSVLPMILTILMLKSLHQSKQPNLTKTPVIEQLLENTCSNPL